MKQTTNSLMHQLPLRQKIAIAFGIPLSLILIVVMFAFTGFKQIQTDQRLIREKLVQADGAQVSEEVLLMFEKSEMKIRRLQILLISVAMIGIVLTLILTFLMARTIPLQAGGSGLPEDARQELAAMRQKVDEILRRY